MKFLNKKLLNLLIKDSLKQDSLYLPGQYWNDKSKKILHELKIKGMKDFRGYFSGVGTSYCDNIVIDLCNEEVSKLNMLLRGPLSNLPILNSFW